MQKKVDVINCQVEVLSSGQGKTLDVKLLTEQASKEKILRFKAVPEISGESGEELRQQMVQVLGYYLGTDEQIQQHVKIKWHVEEAINLKEILFSFHQR